VLSPFRRWRCTQSLLRANNKDRQCAQQRVSLVRFCRSLYRNVYQMSLSILYPRFSLPKEGLFLSSDTNNASRTLTFLNSPLTFDFPSKFCLSLLFLSMRCSRDLIFQKLCSKFLRNYVCLYIGASSIRCLDTNFCAVYYHSLQMLFAQAILPVTRTDLCRLPFELLYFRVTLDNPRLYARLCDNDGTCI